MYSSSPHDDNEDDEKQMMMDTGNLSFNNGLQLYPLCCLSPYATMASETETSENESKSEISGSQCDSH